MTTKIRAVTTWVLALLAAVALAGPATPASAATPTRQVTLVNRTRETIWPAAWPGAIDGRTGWRLAPGHSLTFRVPEHWNARLWGRTGCRFDAAGRGGCVTGDCGGRYQCRGWGAIPATLAEYDLDAYDHLDFYDVSMVDGSNLPMYINTVGGRTPDRVSGDGCEQGRGCTTAVRCPTALRVRHAGETVACISPCARFHTARYCCTGRFATSCSPATTWPIDYARVFKRAEPYAYSWSGDNATSVFTCAGGCGYRVTFGVTPSAASAEALKLELGTAQQGDDDAEWQRDDVEDQPDDHHDRADDCGDHGVGCTQVGGRDTRDRGRFVIGAGR